MKKAKCTRKCLKNVLKFSSVVPKPDLKTCFKERLIAILSSYSIKLAAQRDSELKVSTQICILMPNSHCATPIALKFFVILQITLFLFCCCCCCCFLFLLYQQENSPSSWLGLLGRMTPPHNLNAGKNIFVLQMTLTRTMFLLSS